ncbi:DivIVA domain-containing protein [Lacticaseibacillus mingshuiensis]|uniref:DivIVA domain-containing protein n=1 Tax=Lacticaseibacillus mingshuiensis TaxID=2799574 RepID=A0ABW4CM39_9LACO|nr:DivIVA domain-containing protein [Lacticaseibacillus mingshuiensis]
MALTPLDIHNKEFNVRFHGYDQDQVNDFLSQIIKDYTAVIKDKEDLQKQLADSQEKVKYFTDLKDALNQSILVAQEAADKVKKNADEEANLIQQKAEKNAGDLLTEATDKSNKILGDAADKRKVISVQTEDLKRQTRVFRQRLQVMLESQLEVVKSPEWKELLSSSSEAIDDLDPAQPAAAVDNAPAESVNSEAAGEVFDSYNEVIFPEDEPAPATDDTPVDDQPIEEPTPSEDAPVSDDTAADVSAEASDSETDSTNETNE